MSKATDTPKSVPQELTHQASPATEAPSKSNAVVQSMVDAQVMSTADTSVLGLASEEYASGAGADAALEDIESNTGPVKRFGFDLTGEKAYGLSDTGAGTAVGDQGASLSTATAGLGASHWGYTANASATQTLEDGSSTTHGIDGMMTHDGGVMKGGYNYTQGETHDLHDGGSIARSTTHGAQLDIGKGQVGHVFSTSDTETHADGSSSTSGTYNKTMVGAEGVSYRRTMSSNQTAADGSSVSNAIGGGFDTATMSGDMLVSNTARDADGNATRTLVGTAGAQFGDNGIESGNLAGTAQFGRSRVGAYGTFVDGKTEPELVDGRWVVYVKKGGSVGGNVGLSGESVGGHMGGGAAEMTVHTKTFDDEALARAYYEGRVSSQLADLDSPESLAVGESVTEAESNDITGGATGTTGLVRVGASITFGSSSQIHVRRVDANTLIVEHRGTQSSGASGSIGTTAGSVRAGTSTSDEQRFTVKIDVSNPSGWEQLQYVRDHESIPSGATVLSRGRKETESDTAGGTLLGSSVNTSSSVSNDIEVDAAGNVIETDTGEATVGVKVLGFGHHSKSNRIELMETNGQDRTYVSTSTVDSSSASSAHAGLLDVSGAKDHRALVGGPDGDASGVWELQRSFDPEKIDEYAELMESGARGTHLGMIDADDDFREALAETSDPDERRALVAQYVADGGATALKHIEGVVGASSTDIVLKDDQYLTGAQGRARYRAEVSRFKAQLADPEGNYTETKRAVRDELNFQKQKLGALKNSSRYIDLPAELRAEEISKAESAVTELEGLYDQARQADQDRRAAAEATELEPRARHDHESAESEALAAGDRLDNAIEEQEDALDSAVAAMERQYDGAKHRRYYHELARSDLGYSSLFGDGDERDNYLAIDGQMATGEKMLGFGRTVEAQARGLLASAQTQADVTAASHAITSANRYFKQAEDSFFLALAGYDRIRSRHPTGSRHGVSYWKGADSRMPGGL